MNKELLLKIQRFAGDGDGEIVADEQGLETASQDLDRISQETQDSILEINEEVNNLLGNEAMDEGARDALNDANNYATDVAGGLTEAIGGLGTFITGVISTFQESSQAMISEITEWGNSLRGIFSDLKEGATGTRNGVQIEKGSYTAQEYSEDIKSDLTGAASGLTKISEGTRELVISTVSGFKHTGQQFASLTGNSLVGSIKNLFTSITNPSETSTSGFVSKLFGGLNKA